MRMSVRGGKLIYEKQGKRAVCHSREITRKINRTAAAEEGVALIAVPTFIACFKT